MQARVFVLPGCKLQIFVDEGTQEQAEAMTKQVLAKLQAAGLPIEQMGEIELHRSGVEHLHVEQGVQHEQH